MSIEQHPLTVIRTHPCLLQVPLGLMLETALTLVWFQPPPEEKGVSTWKQGSLGMTTYVAGEVTSLLLSEYFPFKM